MYPRAVRWFVEGRVELLAGGRVRQRDGEAQLFSGL
jgi:hypothetical protein